MDMCKCGDPMFPIPNITGMAACHATNMEERDCLRNATLYLGELYSKEKQGVPDCFCHQPCEYVQIKLKWLIKNKQKKVVILIGFIESLVFFSYFWSESTYTDNKINDMPSFSRLRNSTFQKASLCRSVSPSTAWSEPKALPFKWFWRESDKRQTDCDKSVL